MVHALRQARRVLKHDGYLLDLRPAPAVRHVGVELNEAYQEVAIMKESLDETIAADRAVKEMINAGLLKVKSCTRFECTRRMDSYGEFQTWLQDPARFRKLRSPERLLKQVKEAWKSHGEITKARKAKRRIVVLGPLDLQVLMKSDSKR